MPTKKWRTKSDAAKNIRLAYLIEVRSTLTGHFVPYTPSRGIEFDMAESLVAHLKRSSKTSGRLVEMPTGLILDEWKFPFKLVSPNATRDKVQALRKAAGFGK